MTQEELTALLKAIVRQHLPDERYQIFIYGSRAEGTNRPFSDVDLGIMGPQPVSNLILSDIEEDLENSDLPYLVDVVDFTQVSDKFKNVALSATMPI
jgi:predicted nucleotidyltransferase